MSTSPCLYCRREDVPRTREHVLQQAFRATAILDRGVCADCNAAFSSLDKDFVDAVNFWHLGENKRRPLTLGLAANEEGFALRTRLRPDGLAERAPQFYETKPNEWQFVGQDEEALRVALAELADPHPLVLTSRVVAPDGGRPSLSILRSSPHTYLVEGTDANRVTALCAEMRANGLQVARLGIPTIEQIEGHGPPINYALSLSLERFGRSLAKVALNFVCYRLGIEAALQPAFDALRAFARDGRGDLWAFVKPALLMGMSNAVAEPWITGREHVLILLRQNKGGAVPREAVMVVIGGRFIGSVNLQPEGLPADGLPDGTWLISRCDPAKRRWDDFRMPDDAFHTIVNPAALGMEAEFKAVGAHVRSGP